jgi:GTP cyclohydrolase I
MSKPDRKAAARAIDDFLRAIGRDPKRDPNLAGTGARVADAYIDELCDGYDVDVEALFAASVIDGADGESARSAARSTPEVVSVRDIAVTTMCPHHLLPGGGRATVAFAPQGKLLGIGAIVTLVDAFAHRLTLQETIGEEVAGALAKHLKPRWAGCRLMMSHACMCARGERRHGSHVETVALHGTLTDADRALAHRALGVGA